MCSRYEIEPLHLWGEVDPGGEKGEQGTPSIFSIKIYIIYCESAQITALVTCFIMLVSIFKKVNPVSILLIALAHFKY